jgi:mRNA interferase MazF
MHRGEVWMVNLNPTQGDELFKILPAIVVNDDAIGVLDLRVIVPVTAWQPTFAGCDWLVRLDSTAGNGLTKDSAADTYQIRSVSLRRFGRQLGTLNDADLERVLDGIVAVIGR